MGLKYLRITSSAPLPLYRSGSLITSPIMLLRWRGTAWRDFRPMCRPGAARFAARQVAVAVPVAIGRHAFGDVDVAEAVRLIGVMPTDQDLPLWRGLNRPPYLVPLRRGRRGVGKGANCGANCTSCLASALCPFNSDLRALLAHEGAAGLLGGDCLRISGVQFGQRSDVMFVVILRLLQRGLGALG